MDARDLVRSVRLVGAAQGLRAARAAWRVRRTDARALPRGGRERARVPGPARGAEPRPGGGVVHFERSSLRVRVTAGGMVFCGWDGAAPEPSYALAGAYPQADPRAVLEPDKDGGWRVVSERVLVTVTRLGAVEVRTPGGVVLRRDLPPRWWEPVDGVAGGAEGTAGSRWTQRSEVPADARFFGLGGRTPGPRLRGGPYRLWNAGPVPFRAGRGTRSLTMPVLWVVADAGGHLVFHDNSWDGMVTLREGLEGAGSGHDRPGRCEVRMSGGPLRYWVLTGAPSRVLHGWRALTGAPVLPPRWALGHQAGLWGTGGEREVRRVVAGYAERGLPLSAVHLGAGHHRGRRGFTVDSGRFPDLPALADSLRGSEGGGVRLVSCVDPAVRAEPGEAVYDGGLGEDAFVRGPLGGPVRGLGPAGEAVYPDFTDPRVRKWWGGLYSERLGRGFAGFCHEMNDPVSLAAFGDATLPRSAGHCLESRGGDHREAHNVYALAMARAGFEGVRGLRPHERPLLLSRSGWAGLQRYGGTWTDQTSAGWEGLRDALAQVIGLGLCGVPYCGADVGGPAGSPRPSPELYLRWFQLAAYLPLFRTPAVPGSGRREPWEFGSEVLEHARAALRERERLLPYFATLARLAHRSGAPYVRPLWWAAPKDRALRECEDAFLLGDALLVAPVLEPGVVRRTVRLPRGWWYDTATGRLHRGPGRVVVEAPRARIPVLARAGSVVPVAGPEGGVELEVWAPPPGRTGGGVVASDPGDGFGRVELERFSVRVLGREVVVAREGTSEVGYPVRVRGSGA
ncbi:glycoside hydrolase family 31 protein [Streptomyces pini]|uniref:Alpha-glucosidase n=1 Tax=Streptomyces pini TaxID=1520580 RepID=A0A1I4D3Z3_9ACTN|nr:glycoside hydrolase family 31 protein [Streptomyces pini]SFK87147.1 alpha-glucosidase [Streptomyces pini]